MARRRLNKKVAFVGSAILVIVLLGAIWVLLRLSRDPAEFIRDGDAAFLAKDYETAVSSYEAALKRAKNDALREKILFKLVDASIEIDQWNLVVRYWGRIIAINPKNVKARYGRLKYLYIVADSGNRRIWQQVHTDAKEFLKVAEDGGLLAEDTAKWDVFEAEEKDAAGRQLGVYLHLVKGRAALEMTMLGAVTNKDESLTEAVTDLEQAKKLEPENIDVYRYLAGAAVEKGKILASRGVFEERDKAALKAKALLEEAVEVANDNPEAHVNLLVLKLAFARRAASARDEMEVLEDEYLSLVKRFPASSHAFVALSVFYSELSSYTQSATAQEYLDKAIDMAEKALERDEENMACALNAIGLHNRKFSIYRQAPHLYRLIELVTKALTLPTAQETRGPWSYVYRTNRFRLYSFLAHNCIQQVLEPCEVRTEQETLYWLTTAEDAVHQIEQIFESGQEPQVIKWRGMLELAKGNRESAVKKLYTAYERLKLLKPAKPPWRRDPQFAYLSYLLARVFKDTSEVGAVTEFLTNALYSGIAEIVPEARLDYVETILKFNLWSGAIENIDIFEKRLAPNTRSQLLRIRTYIGAGEFDKATEALTARPDDDPNSIRLSLALVQAKIRRTILNIARMQNGEILDPALIGLAPEEEPGGSAADVQFIKEELNDYRRLEAQLVNMLLSIEPISVKHSSIISVSKHYVEQGQVAKAKELVDRFLQHFPDNTHLLVYKQVLSEPKPDPRDVSQERRNEIERQVLSNIAEPRERSLRLGVFYRRNNQFEKAVVELKKVLDMEASQEKAPHGWVFKEAEEMNPRAIAAGHLFDIAVAMKDWALVEQVVDVARRDDLDGCQGQVFAARLAYTRRKFEDARLRIDECLKQRPVFSRAYSLRSNINTALGDDSGALEDIRRAIYLNPLDGLIAKAFARLLYLSTSKAGENATSDQIDKTANALQRAIALNPYDVQLRSFYADFIAPKEPLKAIAILQASQRAGPTLENAIRLGELATKAARAQSNQQRKDALFAIAESALDQARKIKPRDRVVLHYYAELLRAMGRDQELEQILIDSQENGLLWSHYFQRGQYPEAEKILKQLHQSEPNNTNVVRGLLLIAEKTSDTNAAAKYSQELISLDPSVDNYLIQIQSFLRVGLIREAGLKLQSFTESHPDEPRTLLLRAWLAMKKGQFPTSLELVNRYLESNPDSAAGWRLRGEIRFYDGDMSNAINDLRKSKSLSDESLTRISLARAYLRAKRSEDGIRELKIALAAPGAPLEARLLLEETYLRLERKGPLKKLYDETLKEFPSSVFWLNRAAAFALQTREFDRAEQLYAKSYQIKSEVYRQRDNKGLRFDALYASAFDGYMRALILEAGVPNTENWNPKKLDEASELAKEHLDTDYAPLAYLRMAQAKLQLGHKKTAVEYCRKAVDESETNETLAAEVLLRMFLMLGSQEVENYCTEKLQSNPDSVVANYTMFNVAKVNGQYNKAVTYIDICIQLTDPNSPRRDDYTVKKAELLTLAYQRSSDNKFLEMAIADYESLLAKMPNNISVLNNLAYMLADSNERLAEALRYAERAYNAAPDEPGILDTYGYVLYKNGKTSEAFEYLAAAQQQYEQRKAGTEPEVYEHLGMVKDELGDKSGALESYKQALEVGASRLSDKDKERIKKAIERLSR